jgi:hypothetical protein
MTVKLKDLNSTEQHLVDVTTTELHEVQGGGLGALGGAVAGAGGSILDNKFHGKRVDWKSAAAWGIAGAAGGGIAGSAGGPVGASLSGEG